jgi:polar amino acid transport system substrate-binding protein
MTKEKVMRVLAVCLMCFVMIAGTVQPVLAESTLEVVKKRGKLIAGVKKDVPNFGTTNSKGEIIGFDADIARAVAKKLGVGVELVPVTSATRTALLQQGRIDMAVATMTHYRKRDGALDFSVGYFYSPQTLIVRKGSGINSLADMAGKRAASALGAGAVENMKKAQPKLTVQTFEGYPAAFLALGQGLVDAVGTDIIILAGLRAKAKNPNDFEIVSGATFGGGEYAIGVRENDSDWLDAVNHALMDVWKDGTWRKIYEKWIGPDSELKIKFEENGFKMHTWR